MHMPLKHFLLLSVVIHLYIEKRKEKGDVGYGYCLWLLRSNRLFSSTQLKKGISPQHHEKGAAHKNNGTFRQLYLIIAFALLVPLAYLRFAAAGL